MRLFEIPMVATSLLGLVFLAGLDVPAAQGDFTFGDPVSIESVFPLFNPAADAIACFSPDGLQMYLESDRAGGQGNYDLWVYKRASVEDDWGPPENLGPTVNSASMEAMSSITGDGLELYFCSNRAAGYGGIDIYVTRRATRDSPWGLPTNLGATVNTSSVEGGPTVSSDGLELYFMSNRPGYGDFDLYVSKRATASDPWGDPVHLGPAVNGPANESAPYLSPDGSLLIFQSPRPGGYGDFDLWMARRAGRSAPWQPAVNLGPKINGPLGEYRGCLAPDGPALYLMRDNLPYSKAPILPIADFNGDGKVDARDMALLVDNWGKNTTLCDIGPFPWGDGLVDERDLGVLMESLMTPGSQASDVPCDVVPSWIAPSFAQTQDVYLGTSQEAVKSASRTNPQGVLVSQGQTTNTYDPPGPLEFSRTYYWRVDFVISSPAPAVYQGPVLKFTTAASVYPIKSITAKASSMQAGSGPERTIDGSGLDTDDGHSTNAKDMWMSLGTPPNWIQYEFDKVYALQELWVWNSNQIIEPFIGFGAKTVKIEYSADGTTWTPLANVPEFAKASGKPAYAASTKIGFGGASAKFVKLTIEKSWGAAPQTGLSEVRFFCIQKAVETGQK